MMHYKGLAKLAAKEAKNRALLICETAGMLSLLGEKWAYSAQVESLQQSDGRELLAKMGLSERANHYPSQLSGESRRRRP